MENNLNKHFIENSISEFRKIKELGEKAFSQIKDEDFFWSPDEKSNSIAIIIRHLSGNMISRWTDFLTSDGEKPDRNRDEEFERIFYTDKDDIISRWESGWDRLFKTLNSLNDEDLMKTITIREEPHTVLQAINRQLVHYSYHTGQIVYIAKHLENTNWKSLSIPRGGSEDFNKKMKENNS